jgi:hypothetical protein
MPTIRLNKSQTEWLDRYGADGNEDEYEESAKDKNRIKNILKDYKLVENNSRLTPVKVTKPQLIWLDQWYSHDHDDEEANEGFEEDPQEPNGSKKTNPVNILDKNKLLFTEGKEGLEKNKLYSSDQTQLSEGQKSNVKVNPKNPLTIIKPLRPNILDQMAIDNVNWLASQRRRAGTKWVPVQQL